MFFLQQKLLHQIQEVRRVRMHAELSQHILHHQPFGRVAAVVPSIQHVQGLVETPGTEAAVMIPHGEGVSIAAGPQPMGFQALRRDLL